MKKGKGREVVLEWISKQNGMEFIKGDVYKGMKGELSNRTIRGDSKGSCG